MTPQPLESPARFAIAFYAWLRRDPTPDGSEPKPPIPSNFGIADDIGESIARQCQIAFQDRQIKKGLELGRRMKRS